MTAPTLTKLIHESDLGLRLVSGVGRSSRGVTTASTTELSHPGRYVVKGQLVMTNGLWLATRSPADWARDVVESGAVGIACGLPDEASAGLEDLVSACVAMDFPLALVAPDVSFASIAERVRALTWGSAEQALRNHVARARQFASVEPSYDAILAELRGQTGLTAAVLSSDGEVLARTSSRSFEGQIPALLELTFPNALPSPLDGTVVFPILPSARSRCAMLVVDGDLRSMSEDALLVGGLAATMAAICDMRDHAEETHREAEIALVFDLVVTAGFGKDECAKRLRRLGLDVSNGVRAVCVAGEDSALRTLRTILSETALWRADTPAVVLLDSRAWTVLEEEQRRAAGHQSFAVGWGSVVPTEPTGIRKSMAEARLYLQAAEGGASQAGRPADRAAAHSQLLWMLDPGLADTFADSVLGPLVRWDRDNDSQLLATLTHYFRLDCQLVEASRALFIHSNTLRNRLARIEEITGRSLGSTNDRVDLALALELRGLDEVKP